MAQTAVAHQRRLRIPVVSAVLAIPGGELLEHLLGPQRVERRFLKSRLCSWGVMTSIYGTIPCSRIHFHRGTISSALDSQITVLIASMWPGAG